MNGIRICPAGNTPALRYTCRALALHGFEIDPKPAPDVTHLLLPVPAFEADGRIKGGGILEHILQDLPEGIAVIGGNLNHPALDTYEKTDLLAQPEFVAKNAAITADCAIRLAAQELPVVFQGLQVLILGWGRIGKCLAAQLQAMGARVTVAARKTSDRAILQALGYGTEHIERMGAGLCKYRVIFNTVPTPVLTEQHAEFYAPECIRLDLASKPGIIGVSTVPARGLPGRMAPESAGALIATTLIRHFARKEAAS